MNIEKAVVELKAKFDEYKDKNDVIQTKNCIKKAIDLLSEDELTDEQTVSLNYSIATAYSDIIAADFKNLDQQAIEELYEECIYYFRAALDNVENIKEDTNGLYQQLYTNAGNVYSEVGRILEAMRLFDIASTKYGMFPMAYGNKGLAAYKLAHFLYDPSHSHILAHYSYFCLVNALKHKEYLDLHGNASQFFESKKQILENHYPNDFLINSMDLGNYDFGKAKKEEAYRKWATLNSLFLNELNDAITNPIVATDYLHLPSMIYNIGDDRWKFHYGMINQIKQEYVSARYMFYEGIQNRKIAHLADREVLQIEIDMDVNSFSDFNIRTAFRTLYSLLDRIAFFMNEYFKLGIDVGKVSFRSIWKTQKGQKSILKNCCENNYMLNAIYWLSKDIYDENYKRTTKPKSKEFDALRNRMEHRYVVSVLGDAIVNNESIHKIDTVDLYDKTLELMRVVREAILYLIFAIHIEEQRKKDLSEKEGKVIPQLKTNVMPDVCK